MSDDLTSMRNIGPAFAATLTRAGITSAGALREIGADEAYARVLDCGTRPHFISYYVLVMALQGRPWNDCKGEEKIALRARFDAIKAARTSAPLSAIEAELDAIGVRPLSSRRA
ncbi:MAG: TfoX/Sxy family protein [Rhodobacteraceae bacterium]|nr:TfoX/Sxy family protein [Paracoccaceae bacterium]